MSRQGAERVHGPYKHGNRWRVVFVGANGAKSVESYTTLAEANKEVENARRTACSRTVGEAVTEYLSATATGKQGSDATARYRLVGLLYLPEADSLQSSTPAKVAAFLSPPRKT